MNNSIYNTKHRKHYTETNGNAQVAPRCCMQTEHHSDWILKPIFLTPNHQHKYTSEKAHTGPYVSIWYIIIIIYLVWGHFYILLTLSTTQTLARKRSARACDGGGGGGGWFLCAHMCRCRVLYG